MNKHVKLSEILGALEFQSEMAHYYFDSRTGKVVLITDDDDFAAEHDDDDDDAPEWQREGAGLARLIEDDEEGRFIPLPDPFEIHEWDMMRRFAERKVDDPAAAEALSNAIRGRGAFRYFKDEIHRLGLADQWHAYRGACYRGIAERWCQDNGIRIEPEDSDERAQP